MATTSRLSVAQSEALVTLRSRGPGASLDQEAIYGLASAGLIEVSDDRRVVLTPRGEMAHTDQLPITYCVFGVLPDKSRVLMAVGMNLQHDEGLGELLAIGIAFSSVVIEPDARIRPECVDATAAPS